MRVEADLDRCMGTANCVVVAPDVFDIGDDDQVRILTPEIPESQRVAVEDAVRRCPLGALRVV
jgi:ferredoxin